ncbi:MAG: head-tail connector protein [Rhodocyclaceae bacterium]|nr:head-tail connector protein [Rhodocyclaceae bacterium]
MAAPDISFIKSWCRIDGAEFDLILPAMIADATARASHETGADYLTVDMPESVKIWCAAQVAHWLANPEAAVAATQQKNLFLDGLLDPHRLFGMEVKVV